jgi:Tol biopolymer transport system component
VLPAGFTYTHVSASTFLSVACRSDGSIVAWGDNTAGQLNVPALPPGLGYVEASAGDRHVLAVRSDGSVVAWGDNSYGQCNVPSLPPSLTYVEAAAGWRHSLARRSDGSVVAWGSTGSAPALPPGLTYVEIAAGLDHSLARRSDGSVVAWGGNSWGQCDVPQLPPSLTYVQVAAGVQYSVARTSDGSAVDWGFSSGNVPVLPPSLAFFEVKTNNYFTIARLGIGDCNHNGIPDDVDIQSGSSSDCNANGLPDECELAVASPLDCDGNGQLDSCEIASNPQLDLNHDAILDQCEQPDISQTTTRVSVSSSWVQGNGDSGSPTPANNVRGSVISADARYVAFSSRAANLVSLDTNNTWDIFVRDRQGGTTERVSVSSSGAQANSYSYYPSISADGRYVAFVSSATNLVPGDTNGFLDVFVRDRQASTTECVSVATGGAQGDSNSSLPAISADGRYVAFWSNATNLVPGDTNGNSDFFVRDLQAGTTERVSVGFGGQQGNGGSPYVTPSISADGRYVAFVSQATNLVTGDTNGSDDIFVRDRQAGTTERVSVATGGAQANSDSLDPSISADGRYVAFDSSATNLVSGDSNGADDIFIRDRQAGTTERASVDSHGAQGNSSSTSPSISADGRCVAFTSSASNLVPADTNGNYDEFVHDRLAGSTSRVSVDSAGVEGDGDIYGHPPWTAISADGRYVEFDSHASNLVTADTNGAWDIFVRDRGAASSLIAFCFGDGSVVPCPCNNSGQIGHGCENSAGTGGAVLSASGEASLSSATVQLTTSGELPSAMSIAFQGSSAIAPVLYGDGLRCLGGTLLRLYVKSAVGGSITAPEAGDTAIPMRSALLGDPIPLGASRFYHVYYRDERASFCPAPLGDRFSVTNAIAIAWGS